MIIPTSCATAEQKFLVTSSSLIGQLRSQTEDVTCVLPFTFGSHWSRISFLPILTIDTVGATKSLWALDAFFSWYTWQHTQFQHLLSQFRCNKNMGLRFKWLKTSVFIGFGRIAPRVCFMLWCRPDQSCMHILHHILHHIIVRTHKKKCVCVWAQTMIYKLIALEYLHCFLN